MNFDEYYHSSKSCILPSEKEIAKVAWGACKKEVLKILDSIEHECYDEYGNCRIRRSCITEIEKL